MTGLRKPRSIPSPLIAHVVFVHGLNGDETESWQSSGAPTEFWPNWLQEDIPGTAVWSLGYPAAATHWRTGAAMALPDRAANVLPVLLNEPALKEGLIYFVVHSLGGLVVEETLRLAEIKGPHDSAVADFLRRVRKIAFIGTPHLGADMGTLANVLSFFTRPRETTQGLARNDPHLRGLNTWFRGFAEKNNIEAIVLSEMQRMPLLGMKWLTATIVKPDSADPGLSPATQVIPVDENHDSIRSPRDREADVYKHLSAFISRTVDSLHPDTLVASRIDVLAAEIQQQTDVVAAMRTGGENPVLTEEAERRLWLLRQSRFLVGFDTKSECERLFRETLEGELVTASKEIRRKVCAWCARATAHSDLALAKEMLEEAQKLGGGEENEIAEAFVLVFEGNDKPAAWEKLNNLGTPTARSASFLIAGHGETPEVSLQWLKEAGLSSSDLDPDGKLLMILRLMEVGDWDGALEDVESLCPEDFETTPLLWNCAASVFLAQAMHEQFRPHATVSLPHDLQGFPLDDDAYAMAFRRKAQRYYERAVGELARLGGKRASDTAADYSLWLSLRDPATAEAARQELESSMGDPKHRLRRLPIALDFGLKLDLNEVERELDHETTASGGKSPEAAVARFALAGMKHDPDELAQYIAAHRSQLSTYYNPLYLASIEVEALAKSGQVNEAREAPCD